MKRILAILSLVLLLTACSNESRNPVIKGYRIRQVGGLGFGPEGVTADLTLDIDVENPSASRYTLESLKAILYKGAETSRFADLTMRETVAIEPQSDQTVSIPLDARFTRPLALLSGAFDTDLSGYTADLDLTLRKGALKKRITKERVPLDQLGNLLGRTAKTKDHAEK